MTEFEAFGGFGDEERVSEWEFGLPHGIDLTPLSQLLLPPELASAFSISPEPTRSDVDVDRASQSTFSSIKSRNGTTRVSSSNNNSTSSFKSDAEVEEDLAAEEEEDEEEIVGSDLKKQRKDDGTVVTDTDSEDPSGKSGKRQRLVWTPQLHKRFMDVVAHLGIKNAVPKNIMHLMNVEGLTRENVASHLQKYRLFIKRMQGFPMEGVSSSTPPPPPPPQHILHQNVGPTPTSVPYGVGPPQMMPIPMPVYRNMSGQEPIGYHHYNHYHGGGGGGSFDSNPHMVQQRDWSGNKYGGGGGVM